MRIFIYEYYAGGGSLHESRRRLPPAPLLEAGAAMLAALVADFAALPGVAVITTRDGRLGELKLSGARVHDVRDADQETAAFEHFSSRADWTLVVAPEINNRLLERCWLVDKLHGRLLGCSPGVVQICSDKQATAEFLGDAGVSIPQGRAVAAGERLPEDFPYPAVLKPRLGAGSAGVGIVESAAAAAEVEIELPSRLEQFCPGVAASVAFLCVPAVGGAAAGHFAMPACRQRVTDDGSFQYEGGVLPLPADLAARARTLACHAVRALPAPTGYIGVDLILGDDSAGKDDFVIEVNPRVTSSYLGLRELTETHASMAAAMLEVCQGRPPQLHFREGPIEFDAGGAVRRPSA